MSSSNIQEQHQAAASRPRRASEDVEGEVGNDDDDDDDGNNKNDNNKICFLLFLVVLMMMLFVAMIVVAVLTTGVVNWMLVLIAADAALAVIAVAVAVRWFRQMTIYLNATTAPTADDDAGTEALSDVSSSYSGDADDGNLCEERYGDDEELGRDKGKHKGGEGSTAVRVVLVGTPSICAGAVGKHDAAAVALNTAAAAAE